MKHDNPIMWALAICIILVGMAFYKKSQADEGDTWAVATCCAKHMNAPEGKNYNERNWGVGFEHELTPRWRLAAGTFRTSERIDGMYVFAHNCTLQWRPDMWRTRVCLGFALGPVAGYDIDHIWAALPVLTVEVNRFAGVNLTYVPAGKTGDSDVVGMQIKTTGRWEPLK